MVRVPQSPPPKPPATFHEAVKQWLESGQAQSGPVRRHIVGFGAGPAKGREPNWPARPRPPAQHMRSEGGR